jgi:hypothetical protein
MNEKAIRIAAVLSALSDDFKVVLARKLLPTSYTVVRRRCCPELEQAFEATAKRIHGGLKRNFRFDNIAISHCWQAMVSEASRDEA